MNRLLMLWFNIASAVSNIGCFVFGHHSLFNLVVGIGNVLAAIWCFYRWERAV